MIYLSICAIITEGDIINTVFCVYVHTNKINQKTYIGITSNSLKRRAQNGHGYASCVLFDRAIKKYGWNNFESKILYENLSETEAKLKEIELISTYKSNNNEFGYNISSGGESHSGAHFSDESRTKISAARKGQQVGCNNPFYGKIHSEETRKKISSKLIGKMAGEKNPFYGKHHSEENKQKFSKTRKGVHKYGKNPCARAVLQFDTQGNFMREFDCAKRAADEFGYNKSCICQCCKGIHKTCGGYIWEYKEGA